MTATKEEIGARVDSLAAAHEGDEFVTAVEQLAEEVGPQGRPVLQEVLLERAAAEDAFQEAVRERAAARGWTRRMLVRLDRAGRDEQAARVAAAIGAGDEGRDDLERELAVLRGNRGRAAVVLDELSRSDSARVRSWVPAVGAEILDEDSSRLLLSLTRDRDVAVREAALTALIGLGPEAVAPALPDLRRRLHSKDEAERTVALKALAAAGDPDAAAALRKAGP